jgi:hypothetical protein
MMHIVEEPDSAVIILIRPLAQWLRRCGFTSNSWQGREVLLFFKDYTNSGAHPASYLVGTGVFFLGVKWPGHETDHTPVYSSEVKNSGDRPPLPHMPHGIHRNSFAVTFIHVVEGTMFVFLQVI